MTDFVENSLAILLIALLILCGILFNVYVRPQLPPPLLNCHRPSAVVWSLTLASHRSPSHRSQTELRRLPKPPTRPLAEEPLPLLADTVLIRKKARTLTLLLRGRVLKEYHIALGREPELPKTMVGDGRTPEGHFCIDSRNPNSRFYRALHISYPTPADRERAAAAGIDPGGDIMIHGLLNGYGWIGADHRQSDWTEGCIAVTNEEMDEIWEWVPNGAQVDIRP